MKTPKTPKNSTKQPKNPTGGLPRQDAQAIGNQKANNLGAFKPGKDTPGDHRRVAQQKIMNAVAKSPKNGC